MRYVTATVVAIVVFALLFITAALGCFVILPEKITHFIIWFRLGPFYEYASLSTLISGTLAFIAATLTFRFVLRVYREIEKAEPLPPQKKNHPTPPPANLE
jgi:hypothetical protein